MAMLINQPNHHTSALPFVTPCRCPIADPSTLVEAVQAVVQKIDEGRLRPVAARCGSLAFHPRVLLAVLTYCYARQIYAASEVLDYLIRDDAFCEVCQREFPNPREIEGFRQQNRSVLESCLSAVLRFLAEQNILAGLVTRANETIIAEEAKRRIIMAACLNGLELAYEHPPVAWA